MRLHKLLANSGVGSRRMIEEWIKEGRVKVNGVRARIGQEATLKDKIHVNDKLIDLKNRCVEETRVLIYHKAEGEICARVSEEGNKTVFDYLPSIRQGKWIMVGRLDVNTSGLLLFTNNGELAHRLMHPRFQVPRHYAVRVLGNVNEAMLMRLKQGIRFEEGLFRFKEIIPHVQTGSANQWFTVVLQEGKYREVRRLWESQGCTVSRLIRVKHGIIDLPREVRKSHWQELSPAKITKFIASVQMSKEEIPKQNR